MSSNRRVLYAGRGAEDVRVHRVARPDDRVAGLGHRLHDRRERIGDAPGAHPADQGEPAGRAVGVEPLAQVEHVGRARGGADLAAERVADAGEELGVGAVRRARALPHPQHVRGAVVPAPGERVAPRQRLLVVEQEALVARPHVHLVQPPLALEVDAAGRHERERALDLGGDALVPAALRRAGDELLVPQVHLGQVGEPALRERPQQVERRRRLVVALQHALGVGGAGGRAWAPRRAPCDRGSWGSRPRRPPPPARSAASRTGRRCAPPSPRAAWRRRSAPPPSAA